MTRHEAFSSDPGASWHEAADVVVVGYGYAGAVAALEAHDAGADVLLIEKMPDAASRSTPNARPCGACRPSGTPTASGAASYRWTASSSGRQLRGSLDRKPQKARERQPIAHLIFHLLVR
jgi:glycine/D-amino acid oxidase-like deaminating enzyme